MKIFYNFRLPFFYVLFIDQYDDVGLIHIIVNLERAKILKKTPSIWLSWVLHNDMSIKME